MESNLRSRRDKLVTEAAFISDFIRAVSRTVDDNRTKRIMQACYRLADKRKYNTRSAAERGTHRREENTGRPRTSQARKVTTGPGRPTSKAFNAPQPSNAGIIERGPANAASEGGRGQSLGVRRKGRSYTNACLCGFEVSTLGDSNAVKCSQSGCDSGWVCPQTSDLPANILTI
jgi:hypothetical protein